MKKIERAGNAPGGGGALCDEARMGAAFAETRGRVGREHVVGEAETLYITERRTEYSVSFMDRRAKD